MIRVGFLAEALQFRRTGLGNYAYHILWGLSQVEGFSYDVFFNYLRRPAVDPRTLDLPSGECVRYRTTRYPGSLLGRLLNEFGMPAELVYGRQDILHSPDAAVPVRAAARTVVTFHDLIPYVLPRLFPEWYSGMLNHPGVGAYMRQVPRTIERADHFIVVSESTASDLTELFGVTRERMTVIPYGIDTGFRPRSREECLPTLAKYGLGARPFVLLVGRIEHRKNHATALRAVKLLQDRGLAEDHDVVLCGAPVPGPEGGASQQEIESVGVKRLSSLGYVSPDDMPAFYAAAALLLFPTRYEGFGFPAIEAMASGTPVVTSRNSSLPEVVGDAALLADSEDVEELAEAVRRCIYDAGARNAAIQAGLCQASKFTWPRAAAATAAVYRSLL